MGVVAYELGSTVSVGGSVTASGTEGVGVYASGGGVVTIGGTMTAPVYILLEGIEKAASDGVQGITPYEKLSVL